MAGSEDKMKLEKLYLESISHFHPSIQEYLLKEAPKTWFKSNLPGEFAFLKGSFADLGFEDLGLSPEGHKKLLMALSSTGVSIPNSEYRMRLTSGVDMVFEPKDGTETAELPAHWKRVITAVRDEDFTWIGKDARENRRPVGFDPSKWEDKKDGWSRI